MSNPANAQSSYSPPTQQAAPGAYAQQAPRASAPLDQGVLRQILFGGAVVVGIAIVSNLLSIVGSSVYALDGELILSLFWNVFLSVVFVAGAGVSALFLSPFTRATSAIDVLKKLAIAAAIGAAALFVLNFIWSVANAGQYLVQMIISSGILGSISNGLTYGAFFALGVLVARMLPPRSRDFAGQPQGYAGQGSPQGYAGPPPGSPQAQQPIAQGYPQPPSAGTGAPQAYGQQPNGVQAHGDQRSYGEQAYGQQQAPAAPEGQPPVQP